MANDDGYLSPTTGFQKAYTASGRKTIARLAFSVAAGGSNICEVTITAKDAEGNTIARTWTGDITLSDSSTGAGLTDTTASGTVTAKSSSGIVISTATAKKAIRVQSLSTGVFVLEITDSAKTAFYVTASLGGEIFVNTVLATANYG